VRRLRHSPYPHSLGGAATLVVAAQIEHVKAVVTIGAPFDSTNVLKQFGGSLDAIKETGEVELLLGGRPFKIKKQFIEDAVSHNVTDYIIAYALKQSSKLLGNTE